MGSKIIKYLREIKAQIWKLATQMKHKNNVYNAETNQEIEKWLKVLLISSFKES